MVKSKRVTMKSMYRKHNWLLEEIPKRKAVVNDLIQQSENNLSAMRMANQNLEETINSNLKEVRQQKGLDTGKEYLILGENCKMSLWFENVDQYLGQPVKQTSNDNVGIGIVLQGDDVVNKTKITKRKRQTILWLEYYTNNFVTKKNFREKYNYVNDNFTKALGMDEKEFIAIVNKSIKIIDKMLNEDNHNEIK